MLPKQARGTFRKHITKPPEQVAAPPSISLTLVSTRTVLLSTGTCVTVDGVLAILVEDAVAACLLEGVEAAVGVVIASPDALLQTRHLVRVHKVPFALVGVEALSGRGPWVVIQSVTLNLITRRSSSQQAIT